MPVDYNTDMVNFLFEIARGFVNYSDTAQAPLQKSGRSDAIVTATARRGRNRSPERPAPMRSHCKSTHPGQHVPAVDV